MSEEIQDEKTIPTKEDIIKMLTEQIEVRKLQAELAECNERVAKAQAGELQALNFMAGMKNPQNEDAIPHTVTEEDLENNPSLAEQGIGVGDEILIPNPEARKERKLKKA